MPRQSQKRIPRKTFKRKCHTCGKMATNPLVYHIVPPISVYGQIPIYQNVSAKPISEASAIKENIVNQLEYPVLWLDTILNMKQAGISDFFEVGPGRVLKGLNQRIYPESTTISCDKIEHLDTFEVL